MTLRFYFAGEASSDNGDNWRHKVTKDECFRFPEFKSSYQEYDLVRSGVLPGGFDYVGPYIFDKGHNAYGCMPEIANMHEWSLSMADVLFVWAPGWGEGTAAEIGYARAFGKPIVYAHNHAPELQDEDDSFGLADHDEEARFSSFVFNFARIKKSVYGATPLEAWNTFTKRMMQFIRYEDYLTTSHWQRTRREVFGARGKFCQRCFSSNNLQVHHLTYERVGREYLDDLLPLCERCHQLEHAKVPVS